ncbi:heme ABC transporter ATP-binding protein [Paracoccus pacificus]|uniref:Heme ABC transporter ATP-binding protein n=1 Tax=Paracoccus pacificus TaxID=1463598 RepID=A0ABW4R4K1_9RHOB
MSLSVTQLSWHRDGRAILDGVDLSARAGEVTAIIGANGSGKTTLLRHLTGEIPAERGCITLDGTDLGRIAPAELARRRAVLPQAAALSFPFTVAEVVALGLQADPAPDPARIPAALARVDLPGHGGRMYQQLSGGEQARVQLARVLVQVWRPVTEAGPAWLFLDEPVSALDIAHQLWVMREARRFAEAGGGVVVVLHDLNLTAMVADRVALLDRGRVLAVGAPSAVLTGPLLSAAYGCRIEVGGVPPSGLFVLPQMAAVAG